MTESKCEITQLVINIPKPEGDGFDFIELTKRIWLRKFWIIVPPILTTLIAVFVVLFILPELYISKVVIQLIDSPNKNRIQGTVSGNSLIFLRNYNIDNNDDQIIANYLDSYTFKEKLITDMNILQHLYPDLWDEDQNTWKIKDPENFPNVPKEVRKGILDDLLHVNWSNKSKLFIISYIDQSPAQAQKVVGGILIEIERYLSENRKVDLTNYREFLEAQLAEVRKELIYWENHPPGEIADAMRPSSEIEALKMVYAECRYQLSLARVKENHPTLFFTVLDKPTFPIRISPKRGRICAMTLAITFFTILAIICFLELTAMISKNRSRTETS